ncbi:hypothetical protein MHYP_G00226870, partial [Metynnis hypsauchen]
ERSKTKEGGQQRKVRKERKKCDSKGHSSVTLPPLVTTDHLCCSKTIFRLLLVNRRSGGSIGSAGEGNVGEIRALFREAWRRPALGTKEIIRFSYDDDMKRMNAVMKCGASDWRDLERVKTNS